MNPTDGDHGLGRPGFLLTLTLALGLIMCTTLTSRRR
jgi:hypothetical protein